MSLDAVFSSPGTFGVQSGDGPEIRISPESNLANAELAPLLLPYETLTTATGAFGPRRFEIAVMAHADEESAIENARRLADRLVNSNSTNGLPMALAFPSA